MIRIEESFYDHIYYSIDSCWYWVATLSHGYGCVTVKGKLKLAHRHSWELVNGAIPKGLHLCHSCDNTLCVNPDHLFLGTAKDNMQDKVNKGRHYKGNDHHSSKLDDSDIPIIKNLYSGGLSQSAIAKKYGCDQSAISRVVNGKQWKHVNIH